MADSGPRHYQQAEDLLKKARITSNEADRTRSIQEAQVHATLALVAATIQGGQLSDNQIRDWQRHGLRT
jgi:hypothetical protein